MIVEDYKDTGELFAMIFCGIWKAQNDMICNDKYSSVGTVIFKANAVQKKGTTGPTGRFSGVN